MRFGRLARLAPVLVLALLQTGCGKLPWWRLSSDPQVIRERGELVVLTRYAPTVYYEDRDGKGAGPPLFAISSRVRPEQLPSILRNGRGAMPGIAVPPSMVQGLVDFLYDKDLPAGTKLDDNEPGFLYRFAGYSKLLDDADRLAAEGRYDEATHLLLKRSVGQIARARPDLLAPSSTAREIADLRALPEAARGSFAVIAERVERSLFALRGLSADDWQAARAAYAEFALAAPAPM